MTLKSANFEDSLDLDCEIKRQRCNADCKSCVTTCLIEDLDKKLGSPIQDKRMIRKLRRRVHEATDFNATDDAVKVAAACLPEMREHIQSTHPRGFAAVPHAQVGAQFALDQHAIERGQLTGEVS